MSVHTSLIPSLWFDDQLEEAAAFYCALFPRSEVTWTARYGEAGPGEAGTVMAGEFVLDGLRFRAINGGPMFHFTEAVSFVVECADQAEVDHYWFGLLADGGEESQCGWLKDRFGLSWQVTPTRLGELLGDPDPARAQAATRAMLGMRRIVVADLEAAADAAAGGVG
ncbi:VOC family protein [Nocardioides bruguierae]|uniref:VOC family protein n=1 Tax=Nocardioides bruguierae TaxID=2945102 RepID=UPI002021FCE7|nr:VOC family protein [Nocardioides bruguierae]MCL8026393.1 VOC family protein [Nocardioides bruguierae]